MHVAEGGSDILVLGSCFFIGMMLSMSANACSAKPDHAGI
jgi:hypothetical protein